jgi:hypothetical protein
MTSREAGRPDPRAIFDEAPGSTITLDISLSPRKCVD